MGGAGHAGRAGCAKPGKAQALQLHCSESLAPSHHGPAAVQLPVAPGAPQPHPQLSPGPQPFHILPASMHLWAPEPQQHPFMCHMAPAQRAEGTVAGHLGTGGMPAQCWVVAAAAPGLGMRRPGHEAPGPGGAGEGVGSPASPPLRPPPAQGHSAVGAPIHRGGWRAGAALHRAQGPEPPSGRASDSDCCPGLQEGLCCSFLEPQSQVRVPAESCPVRRGDQALEGVACTCAQHSRPGPQHLRGPPGAGPW